MIIFISGPMTGIPEYNKAAFDAAQRELESRGHVVLNPASISSGMPPENYMLLDLTMLDKADAICLLPGSENSPGSRLERDFAAYQHKEMFADVSEVPAKCVWCEVSE